MRTRSGALLLAAALFLLGCGDRDEGAGGAGADGATDTGTSTEAAVDTATFAQAADAADLTAALAAGERIVTDLVATLDVDEREQTDVRPYRVSLCDEVADDAPSLVSVARQIAFPTDRTDDVVARIRGALEDAGLDGVDVVGEDGDVPLVTGVFADDTWQVAATLNRPDGIGEVRVNSACLPGDLPDARTADR